VTGRGVLGVASQSLPSVRQLSGAATGVFSGEGKGGTGGGLTVFVGVGAGFSMGVFFFGLAEGANGFVGLVEVGVTGASCAGGLEAAQPIVAGQRCGHVRLLWSVVRRAQYKSRQRLKDFC